MSIVSSALQNSAGLLSGTLDGSKISTEALRRSIMGEYERAQVADVIFDARTRVRKVDNGYILEINGSVKIAHTPAEVRDLIMAEMAAFQLER